MGGSVFSGDASTALNMLVPETARSGFSDTASTYVMGTAAMAVDPRAKAKMQGFEGDPCGECGNYTLVRNGTCMKCNTCGGTSGCS
jgi:ribonucleoside-diphosphate reductase alpha chain